MRKGTQVKVNIDLTSQLLFNSGSPGIVLVPKGAVGKVTQIDRPVGLAEVDFGDSNLWWVKLEEVEVANGS